MAQLLIDKTNDTARVTFNRPEPHVYGASIINSSAIEEKMIKQECVQRRIVV